MSAPGPARTGRSSTARGAECSAPRQLEVRRARHTADHGPRRDLRLGAADGLGVDLPVGRQP